MPTTNSLRNVPACVILLITVLAAFCTSAGAQGTLVINGAAVTLASNAFLVIGNPDPAAIRRLGTGYIRSEGAGNQVLWAIGAGDSNTYVVPFGDATGYWPVQFVAAGGVGATGRMVLSTFPTATATNSDDLPPGVTNMTIAGGDNSASTIDRFWQVQPQGYTTNPSLSNLVFAYPSAAIAPPNTIAEANLMAYRWNPPVQSWTDYTPASLVNTATHTVTVTAISGNQLHDWWTLADGGVALPIRLIDFTATENNGQVLTAWVTASEQNTDHYEVWRSKDGQQWELTGEVAAAGNSVVEQSYSFTDRGPYPGVSYYRLRSVDLDQQFTWSTIVSVNGGGSNGISLYPSPAVSQITIQSPADIIGAGAIASLFDDRGRLLRSFLLQSIVQTMDISTLVPGMYLLTISYTGQLTTLSFLKR